MNEEPHNAPDDAPVTLSRRNLGQTSVDPTVLTLGTWGLAEGAYGGGPDRAALETMVRAALDQGVRSFDTAPLWGDGMAEEVVGAAIRDRRSECVVITRAGAVRKGEAIVRAFDANSIAGSLDASRRRLGTDYVDALLLHDPPEKALFDGSFAKALAGLEARSAIHAWGISTTSVEAAQIAMGFGAKVICVPHHVLAPDVLAAITEQAEGFGVGVLVRSPLAHGMLTTAGVGTELAPDDHRSRRWSATSLVQRRRQADGMSAVWTQKAPSLEAFALRFALSSSVVGSAVIGPRTPEELAASVAAVRGADRLDPALVQKTAQLAAVLGV